MNIVRYVGAYRTHYIFYFIIKLEDNPAWHAYLVDSNTTPRFLFASQLTDIRNFNLFPRGLLKSIPN